MKKLSLFFALCLLTLQVKELAAQQECLTSLQEIYNFTSGDIFQYRNVVYDGTGGDTENSFITIKKYTIDGREYRSDSLIYFYTGLQHSYRIFESIQTDDLYETISGELVYVDSAGALQNTCRDTVLMTIDEEGPLYGFVKDTLINGIPGKFAGGEFNSGTLFRRENGGPYLPDQFLAEHSELYVNGIGLMYIYHTVFEQGYRVILEGYTKNGLTFGEVSDDSELNGGTDGSVKEDLEFFPNPAGSFLNLHFQHYPVSGVLSVYSADGSQVLIREFDGSQTDVSMLPAGLYLAVLSDRISGKKLCGKFLKK